MSLKARSQNSPDPDFISNKIEYSGEYPYTHGSSEDTSNRASTNVSSISSGVKSYLKILREKTPSKLKTIKNIKPTYVQSTPKRRIFLPNSLEDASITIIGSTQK